MMMMKGPRKPWLLPPNWTHILTLKLNVRIHICTLLSQLTELLDLLAPLTAASDLPGHPTLSKPFLSKTLTELTRQAGEMVQKEKASLWRIKHLLTRLSGDNTWITCESVEDQNDITLFEDERERHRGDQSTRSKDDGDHLSTGTLISDERAQTQITDFAHPGEAIPNSTKEKVPSSAVEGADGNAEVAEVADKFPEDTVMNDSKREDVVQGDRLVGANKVSPEGGTKEGAMDVDQPSSQPRLEENIDKEPVEGLDGVGIEGVPDDQEDLPAPHRMRTRAQAQAASDNTASRTRSMTPDSSAESFVHPYFLAPRSSHPDRDLGLPQHEADEIRRSLQLYIQKQEEICRGAQRVYEGLLKADRYRRSVMKWAKAEAHVGVNRDMSDGEDWYDKEEWGLEEDLKKGNDEEEEDAATTAKKTRTRRQ